MSRQRRVSRSSRAMVGCEALEHRELLSRGMGLDALGGMGGGRRTGSMMAELGSFGGGGPGAMFGGGSLGLGGGMKRPALPADGLAAEFGQRVDDPALEERAVVLGRPVGVPDAPEPTTTMTSRSGRSRRTRRSASSRMTSSPSARARSRARAATTAIQTDEAAILTSMGLTSSQVSQIQSDLQAVQTAIQSASSSGTSHDDRPATNGPTTTAGTSSTTTTAARRPTTGSSTTPTRHPRPPPELGGSVGVPDAAVGPQERLVRSAQPTHASVGQVQDDLGAIQKGTLTGSQAVTTIQADTAAVLSSMGLSQSQITQIQSDQSAVATAMQAELQPDERLRHRPPPTRAPRRPASPPWTRRCSPCKGI